MAVERKKGPGPHNATDGVAAQKKSPPRGTRGGPWRIWRWLAVSAVWLGFGFGMLLAWYAHDLPDTSALGSATRRPSVTLVTGDGRIIASYGDLYGEPLGLGDLPSHLKQAVIATEDRRFYEHFGVDIWGVMRAIIANLWHGEIRQGGSTITQQLAKNLFLTPDRTIKRKVQETMLALWLEGHYTKDDILTIYLNRVYFGAGTYGVDAAARKFFGKSARDLNLYESAMLAGLLKAPSRYNPANDPETAKGRADQVLVSMLDSDYLSEAEVASGHVVPNFRHPSVRSGELYFADWVLERVHDHVGFTDRDLFVVTTLDTELQELAQHEVGTTLIAEGAELAVGQAALVVLSPDGAVRAMVGGRDYGQSQFNRATQALRQPGSAFKIFVYLAGLQAGFRPDDVLVDGPIRVGRWRPTNYTGKYRGAMTIKEAVARSVNTIAVTVTERAGRGRVIDNARRLGISSNLKAEPSLALGSHEVHLVELTGAYAALANGGYRAAPFGIAEIRDRMGEVLFRPNMPAERTIPLWQVGAMNEMFVNVIENGTGRNARVGRPAAGKTGTSQDWRDAWFVGYTSALVAGVWVGNDDNTPMNEVTGGNLPARLWGNFMAKALHDTEMAALPGIGTYNKRRAAAPAQIDDRPAVVVVSPQPVRKGEVRESPATPPRTAESTGGVGPAVEQNGEVFSGPVSTQGLFER
ncbi:MAG: PBP1A family penicillin-binding protein [Alphaproteobacteria bacterium]|nr:PBP1A family penicillin-binding protein [Alphaproteobacteria bacterium]